jgi:magnesium transporter
MGKIIKNRSMKKGKDPGTLIHIGRKKIDKCIITKISYNKNQYTEKKISEIDNFKKLIKKDTTDWINIEGLHDVEIIEKIGNEFKIHPLVLEDILNTDQRPKFEDYKDYLFIVMKVLTYDQKEKTVVTEQISLIIGENFLLTFQETEGDIFDPIRNKIKLTKGKIRQYKADFIAYSLMDVIIDNYFSILENIGEKIEIYEEELINKTDKNVLKEIYKIKRENIILRKNVWPLREVINRFEKTDSKIIKKRTHLFLKDIYDHIIQVIDIIETFRDLISGMLDLYLSNTSNKMNEIMKVLTIIATIFIPLTFIAGVYGMNFDFMPELHMRYAYYVTWGIMISIGGIMLYFFKKKEWI